MGALAAAGEGTSEEAKGGIGGLVVVPVVQADKWQGSAEASAKAGNSENLARRRGKDWEAGSLVSGAGGEEQGSGSSHEKAERGGEEKPRALEPVRKKVQGPIRVESAVEVDLSGPGQGGSSLVKSSPNKSKSKGAKGLNLGSGCCWGTGQVQVGQGGGMEEGDGRSLGGIDGGEGKDGGLDGSPPVRGKVMPAAGGGVGSPGSGTVAGLAGTRSGTKGLWKKGSVKERKGGGRDSGGAGPEGGSPGNCGRVCRERSRSPVGIRRGRGGRSPRGILPGWSPSSRG